VAVKRPARADLPSKGEMNTTTFWYRHDTPPSPDSTRPRGGHHIHSKTLKNWHGKILINKDKIEENKEGKIRDTKKKMKLSIQSYVPI